MFKQLSIAVLLSISLTSVADDQKKSEIDLSQRTGEKELKIATYNLYNLFDVAHDEGKSDFTYLPKDYPGKMEECKKISNRGYRKLCEETDWNEARLELKLGQLKKVIDAQGDLPDLLGVQEIENDKVTAMLAEKLGYKKFLVTNSPDRRGIDVALLYRTEKLELLEWTEVEFKGKSFDEKPTRNMLRAHFSVKGSDKDDVLAVYVNHWPSQAAPADKRYECAVQFKADLAQQREKYGDRYHVISMGDFNTLKEEYPNAFHHVVHDPNWEGRLLDTQRLSRKFRNPQRRNMPPYSYWYKHDWQKLDRIVISQNLLDSKGMEALPKTFRIFAAPFMSRVWETTDKPGFFLNGNREMIPVRSNFNADRSEDAGYSDHLPVIIKLKIQ